MIDKAKDSRTMALPVLAPLCLSLACIVQATAGGPLWLGVVGAAVGVAEIVLGGGFLFVLCVGEIIEGVRHAD